MVEFKKGNIFNSKSQTLVNPVNCKGVMGAGLALEMKKRYPAMFSTYKRICDKNMLIPGKLQLWKGNKWILNFPTKDYWKDPSKIEYIEKGLDKFLETYKEKEITSIAFPKIGSGLGGLDWALVKSIMIKKLNNLNIKIEIYE